MASSSSPCAACKFLRRKCTPGCVFANYFPPDQPAKFANVHRVFGASNVAKLLNELMPTQREDAVNSLAYEAETRLRDPVYGPVGHISFLQQRLKQVQHELLSAKQELATYIGAAAAFAPTHAVFPLATNPHHHLQNFSDNAAPFGIPGMGMMGATPHQQMLIREHQQMLDAHQLAAIAREQQEMQMRLYHQQQNQQQQHHHQHQQHHQQQHHHQQEQHELARLNNEFDGGIGFNHMGGGGIATSVSVAAGPSPSELTLVQAQPLDNMFQVQQHQQYQDQQQHHHPNLKIESNEAKSGIGPSS